MVETPVLLDVVAPDIDRIEKAIRADIDNLSGDLDKLLVEILKYGLFGGGKRFRPLLAVVSSRLCENFREDIYELAIAFEYLHLATLFHDDVIDQADTRRGRAAVCKVYGVSAAILAGDFLHARSMEIIGRHGGVDALDIFCQATRGMVDGEFIQLRNTQNYNQSEDDYFEAINGKTALLISATAEIGGLAGGADAIEQKALREYGRNLGYGFQIVDDLLDYLGDELKTGKAVGNDLAEGKMTLPLIIAMEHAHKKDKEKLLHILTSSEEKVASFSEVYDLISKYNGFGLARKKAEQCMSKAIEALAVFPEKKQKDREILAGLARYALHREK